MNAGATQVMDPAAARFAVLGVTDDRDFCQCCGRQGLKHVVWIEDREGGVVQHFGTTCATASPKGFGLGPAVKAAIARFDDARRAFWICVNAECRIPTPQWPPRARSRPAGGGAADSALKDAITAELRQAAAGLTAPVRFL